MIAKTSNEILRTSPQRNIAEVKIPIQVGISYNMELQKMVKSIKKDIDQQLVPVLRAEQQYYVNDNNWFARISSVMKLIVDKYTSKAFDQLATITANKFVQAVNDKTMSLDIYSNDVELQNILEMSTMDNSRLIGSIADKYLNSVQSTVVSNIRAGNRSSVIADQLRNQYGISSRQAKFIARDQTAKVNSGIATSRITSAGYQYFQWIDSGDSRVRHRHEVIANKVTKYGKGIYRYDDPPLSDNGTPILPGADYQCRCTQKPITNAQVKRNQEKGDTH